MVIKLDMEYSDIVSLKLLETFYNKSLRETLNLLLSLKQYPVVSTILARMIAAKPHNADVERLISFNNILKTCDGSAFSLSTEACIN